MEPHTSSTLYELGRIFLVFALIGLGVWIAITLILRSGKRGLNEKHVGINRQQRRAERAKMKGKRSQSADNRRHRSKR